MKSSLRKKAKELAITSLTARRLEGETKTDINEFISAELRAEIKEAGLEEFQKVFDKYYNLLEAKL